MKLIFLVLILSNNLSAKEFRTSYLSMDIPNNWACQTSQAEHICRDTLQKKSREAFLVIRSKLKPVNESLKDYKEKLSQPKPYKDNDGTPIFSKIISHQELNINGHKWVSALHLGGDIKNYYSHHIATTSESLSILLSFNAHKKKYQNYKPQFDKIIGSIKLLGIAQKPLTQEQMDYKQNPQVPNPSKTIPQKFTEKTSTDDNKLFYILAIILGIVALASSYLKLKK